MVSFIPEHAEVMTPNPARGEARHNYGNVTGTGNHWVHSIGLALEGGAAMRMEISNDGGAASPTDVPEFRECITLQDAHAAGIGTAV